MHVYWCASGMGQHNSTRVFNNVWQFKQKVIYNFNPFFQLTVKREITKHLQLLMNTLCVIIRDFLIAAGDSILTVNHPSMAATASKWCSVSSPLTNTHHKPLIVVNLIFYHNS